DFFSARRRTIRSSTAGASKTVTLRHGRSYSTFGDIERKSCALMLQRHFCCNAKCPGQEAPTSSLKWCRLLLGARREGITRPDFVSESAQYRLVIADDHPLFRGALREAVHGLFEHVDILEAGSFDEVTKLPEGSGDVDLIMLDLTMPG